MDFVNSGSYGVIYKYNNDVIKIPENTMKGYFFKEIEFYKKYKHENIVEFKKLIKLTNEQIYEITGRPYISNPYGLVFEIAKCDLAEYNKFEINIFHDVIKGIDYLNKNGIIHDDITQRNILIFDNISKICDLGSYFHSKEEDNRDVLNYGFVFFKTYFKKEYRGYIQDFEYHDLLNMCINEKCNSTKILEYFKLTNLVVIEKNDFDISFADDEKSKIHALEALSRFPLGYDRQLVFNTLYIIFKKYFNPMKNIKVDIKILDEFEISEKLNFDLFREI